MQSTTLLKWFKRVLAARKKKLVRFLKKFDAYYVPDMDTYVNKANDATWKEVDCLACANCCKQMTPTFTKTDIKRISAHLGMTAKAFYDTWCSTDTDNGDIVNKSQPCQFLNLQTNMCSIYEVRPLDCATFPHFKRKPFDDFNHVHEQNIDYCPATLKFVSKLEEKITREYQW